MNSESSNIRQDQIQITKSNDKAIYFILLSPSEEKIEFKDLKFLSEIDPIIIYNKSTEIGKGSFLYQNVFKLDIKNNEKIKKDDKYYLQYEIGEESYDILFEDKNNIFIYKIQLLKGNKFIDNIVKRNIDQNKIPLHYKLDIFIEALKKNKETDKLEILYDETIKLYKEKKKFNLLISLFLKIYEQNKNLCSKLIKTFKEINEEKNTDRDKDLASYLNIFNQIYSKANNLIEENKYDSISFYGVIFCYLSSYNKENFSKIIKDFSEGNANILYEILIAYYSHFKNPLNQSLEFYNNFVEYTINNKKSYDVFERALNYINDIETFLYVINKNKNAIFEKYDKLMSKPIILSSNLKLIKREYSEENKKNTKTELDHIVNIVEELIEYSDNNLRLAIYLKSSFWVYLLKQYNKPDLAYIDNCSRLRKLFKKYKDLVNTLYKSSSDEYQLNIKEEINRYNDRDEFAFNLNINIKELFQEKKDKYNDEQKLGIIKKYNPYYNNDKTEDDIKYQNLRETDIFDNINFKNPTDEFKLSFHNLNFEENFKGKINEFINKITSKIIDISTFGTIIEIIDINRIEPNKKYDYYKILKDKYEYIIQKEIESLKDGDKLRRAIEILSNFIGIIFLDEKNTNFLEEQIKKLDDKLQSKIYFDLIRKCNDEKYEKIKDYIFEIFLKKLNEADKIIELIKILNDKDKEKFLEKLMTVCEFEKKEYFSNSENNKIKLLCKLNEPEKPIINENNCGKLQIILDEIRVDLEENLITKNQMEEFLNIKSEKDDDKIDIKEAEYNNEIIQKLSLIKIILPKYDPIEKYGNYIKIIKNIKQKINDLNYIKNSLIIFHKKTYNIEIRKLTNIINNIETKSIKEFYVDKTQQDIIELTKLKTKCDEINKVKEFLLFKKIFEKAKGKNQEERFKDALNKLNMIKKSFEDAKFDIETIFKFKFKEEEDSKRFENIFENIKEDLSKLSKKEDSKSEKFISQMIDYFNINDEKKKSDLIIIIKSKKYEKIVKSIRFFLEDCLKKNLPILPKDIELSKMNLNDLSRTLNNFKSQDIYDYENDSPFYEVFTSYYDKKEAVDFLLSKIDKNNFDKNVDKNIYINFDDLKKKLDPTNRSISIKDIDDATVCLNQFVQLKNKTGLEIITHIKNLNEEVIKKLISFSKHYPSIKELDSKNEKDIFEEIYTIIMDASLTFKLDSEIFKYTNNKGDKKKIKIEELINLKNKINIQTDNNEVNEVDEKDIYQLKCDKLKFYKNIISKIEIIYDKIKILRIKGYNIPILINIEIKYPNIIYKFNQENDEEEKDFDFIKNYLFTIKNEYENQLNAIYQSEKHLRFLYGKLFRKIKMHQEGNYEVNEIIRYILNNIDYNDKIIDGEPYNIKIGSDFITEFKEYTKKIFDYMAKYIISLFEKNGLDFEKHYNNMLIKGTKKSKGIFIYKSETISMEEYILYLFQEKLDRLPIAQNILICSNETSIEEMQSFLYRAILCDYNTLFMIEILESFSSFQLNKMYNFIDKLLSYKLEKSKEKNKEIKKINKLNSREYLDSCIYFIYNNLENENSFLNELEKYTIKNKKNEKEKYIHEDEKKQSELSISNISDASNSSWSSKLNIQDNQKLENIKVYSSEICGLGKSFKIKKTIKDNGEIYYHFPLGGRLSKMIIYQKLLQLLNRIKKDPRIKDEDDNQKNCKDSDDEKEEINLNYNKVAIHLDLIETEDISLINEFLLSFLITKFYNNNENIIYIPNNIKIYVEIPNSFENYLKKVGILNSFKIDKITLGNLPKLQLDESVKKIFNLMLGKEVATNEQIEKFIKDNITLKEYSYYQIQTFINLFISQFGMFNEKIKLFDSQNKDVTKKVIKYFADSSIYFTNGGFAKLIIDKKQQQKNKIDLCLDAYENDLSRVEFKTPLIYIDKKTKKWNYEKLPDLSKEIIDIIKEPEKQEVDICYLIDATGSMDREINAANDYVIQIFEELAEKYKEFKFKFGAAFYRDKIDYKKDENEFFPLTNNMEDLKRKISKIRAQGGGDVPEDWVEGYNLALNMNWRNGLKLIIHIADAGAHGKEFSKNDKYPEEGPKLEKLIKECVEKNINIIGFKVDEEAAQSFEKISEIYNQHKLFGKDNGQFIDIYNFIRGSSPKKGEKDPVSEKFHRLVIEAANQVVNPSYKFLKRLKNLLNLPNEVNNSLGNLKSLSSILDIGSENYVITEDNYKKMILLVYRIKANIPVIIMGETGCGKTSLIKKLSQILNNGEEIVKIINIHPGIKDDEISEEMKKINKKAKEAEYIDREKKLKKELWIFFDEINTCLSLSLLTEIFINRTFNGEKLENNIRLIGACNPYRRRIFAAEKSGLTREDDKEDDLVYKVEQLPQSLLYFVFSFGTIQDADEKKYIKSIIKKLFDKKEENLHKLTTEAISKCHIFLRKIFKDPSIVSLREIARFTKCVEFFQDYFLKKSNKQINNIDDEIAKLYKIKSIICSIYLCYYIRLINDEIRGKFDFELQKTLLKLVNVYSYEKIDDENKNNLFDKIKNKKLIEELSDKNMENFSDFLKIEEEFLLKQIELEPGIGKNELLKENLFLLFLSVVTKIPLIIVGKPGTGKSLSVQLLYNSMRGKYSKNEFFKKYPSIIQIYFQGAETTDPEDIIELFRKAENLYENYRINRNKNDIIPIYMILFDELGLAEKSPTNPLKVLHSKLEYDGKKEGVCFIGISNYSLDAAKINRALSLSVPNLEDKLDQLKSTAKSIVESISKEISKDTSKIFIFYILSRAYYLYKYYLNFIKSLTVLKKFLLKNEKFKGKNLNEIEAQLEYKDLYNTEKKIKKDFHGNRDFYNIIKGVAIEGSKLNNISDENQIVPIIENYIERNFGGINISIDIDFKIQCDDIKDQIDNIKEILKDKIPLNIEDEEEIPKVTSVYLFKKIYNEACNKENNKNLNLIGATYKIKEDHLDKYDLNKCINDNINDNNSRYLLLEIKSPSSLAPLINRIIKIQNPEKNILQRNGSPFSDDNNNEYKVKKVGEIQDDAKEECVIIQQKLDPIQPYLYDLYNMNYKIIDEKKYVRICLDNFSEYLTPVNDAFRAIILVEKRFVNSVDMAFLNRLEKMKIKFDDLLDEGQKALIKTIMKTIRIKDEIKRRKQKINYDLNNLLINCDKDQIGGCVYYFSIENKAKKIKEDDIKDRIYSRISNILPQDIIINLQDDNPLKEKYFEKKRYSNFKEYIKDLESARISQLNNYKISIIYTFSNISNIIEGADKTEQIMISEIKAEDKLKNEIDDIKNKNKNEDINKNIILINFEQYNSDKIQFIADYINNECINDGYNYIFIIHIQRSFDKNKKEIIYSLPNIYDNINQLFIDNLQGSTLTLKQILRQNVKDVMFNTEEFKNLDKEFKETLINFVYEQTTDKSKSISNLSDFFNEKYEENNEQNTLNEEKYIEEILKYMTKNSDLKKDLIKKAKELIEIDPEAQGLCQSLIDKMIEKNHINKNSIDIISCALDYIKENIFKKSLMFIFKVLEDNNFLTTLIEIGKDRNIKLDKNEFLKNDKNKNIIKELLTKFLKEIKVDDEGKYKPKFLFNYKIPGFYNFYKNLSDYIEKNISNKFYENEKKLRDKKIDNLKNKFYEKEKDLLNKTLEMISKDKLYFDLINRITPDIILKDYIIFYIAKLNIIYSPSLKYLIELLLNLRFSEEKEIIKNNISNPYNIIIFKIIWLESNINYIKSIFSAFDIAKDIVNDKDGTELYQKIYDIIYDNECRIRYIVDDERNPELKQEVNECFYILLSGICLSIISKDVKLAEIRIKDYHDRLKEISMNLQNINYDLKIYLNELFIIDELIKIIEYQLEKGIKNMENIEDIREKLVENSKIIQKNKFDKIDNLIENFLKMNQKLKEEKDEQFKDKYYETLKYIYMQEIIKVNEITYRATILGELMKEKEVIKLSNDIFQILLSSYVDKNYFIDTKKELLKIKKDDRDDIILKLIDNRLTNHKADYYLSLSETIIYFFEKNSLNYLYFVLNKKKNKQTLEDDPLLIFLDCNDFLYDFKIDTDKFYNKCANITKLFCLGYIKSFCYMFIKRHDKPKFDPEEIIKEINLCDKIKMVKLYIFKIIFNQNNKQFDILLQNTIRNKYKLDKYDNFKDFIKFNEKNFTNEIYNEINDNGNYQKIYKNLSNYQRDNFENPITKKNIIVDSKLNFDDFFMVANYLILSKLKNHNYENEKIYINFYNNICEPLFKKDDDNESEDDKLLLLIKFIFESERFKEIINTHKIEQKEIEVLLYGYRYCLNEISEKHKNEEDYIYSYLYDQDNFEHIDEKFYPGCDTKENSYYELYNKIENHFEKMPNQGCYVCLCDKGYYHSVLSGFPSFYEFNIECPNCNKSIGSTIKYLEKKDEKTDNVKLYKVFETVKRENYFRIFKDKDEIDKLNRNKDKYNKLKELNFMTLEDFKNRYILPLYNKEKGLNKIDKNTFKKDNKKIRNLSQLSYRLLNYILYSHLFFAKLLTCSDQFDDYLPNGMEWFETIKECFNLLKSELNKKGIKKIDIFMNLIFKDLFKLLHNKKCINNFGELILFEDELEKLIQDKFNQTKNEINRLRESEIKSITDYNSSIALFKEIYNKDMYKKKDYLYYENFYYTDYLDEEYIENILEYKDKNEYPILLKYLEYKRKKNIDDDKYFLSDLSIFNEVLNLFSDKYCNQITREYAQNTIIKSSDIYNNKNQDLIDDFIDLYNSLEIKVTNNDGKEEKLELDVNKNHICDFFLIDENKYGKSYKEIYKKYIKMQNKELEDLINKKIENRIFNENCKIKINVQQIKENEIFTFDIPKIFNFISVVCNSSYRKIIDTGDYENYNEFEINIDTIEDIMTDLLLKNKKLLNDELIEFSYDNEIFSNNVSNLIKNFKYDDTKININDKLIFYNYIIDNKGNNDKYRMIINNFITLIEYLNKTKKEEGINGNTKIYGISIVKNKKNISDDFLNIFKDKDDLIVNKIPNMFDYYLKIIFKYIKKDIEKYQEQNENKNGVDKNKENIEEIKEEKNININEKIIQKSDEIFSKKDIIIKKESLASAIRLFISLVLYREQEKDKDKKIKFNKKNIVDYLKGEDLWETRIYKNSEFEKNLGNIKELNIKINGILWYYNYLIDYKDEKFEEEIEQHKKKLEEEEIRIKKEKEKKEKEEREEEENRKNKNRRRRKKIEEEEDEDDDEAQRKRKRRRKKEEEEDEEDEDNTPKSRRRRRQIKQREEEEEDEDEDDDNKTKRRNRRKKDSD